MTQPLSLSQNNEKYIFKKTFQIKFSEFIKMYSAVGAHHIGCMVGWRHRWRCDENKFETEVETRSFRLRTIDWMEE